MCGEDCTIRAVASTPLSRGMCRSIRTTSGCSSRARSTAVRPSAAAPTTSTESAGGEHRLQTLPEVVVVVDHEDPQPFHRPPRALVGRPASGSRASTTRPASGRRGQRAGAPELLRPLPHRGQPDTRRRRSAARPTPSSRTRTRSAPVRGCSVTVQASAALWRTALFTASIDDPVRRHLDRRGQRLEVVVGPRGSRSSGRSPRADRTARLCSSARCRRAETRPSWSSAGGRRPSTSRRTSAISSRACSESWLDQRRPRRPGPSAMRSRAASSRMASVARDGPRPSWRSRRTRRRSSSRAVIRSLAGPLQLAVDRHRLDQRAHLAADVLEQPPVAPARTGPGRVHLELQPTHGVPPTTRSTTVGRSARLTDRGLDRVVGALAVHLDGGVGQLQPPGQQGERLAQGLRGRGERVEPAQLGDDLVRGRPVAVDQPPERPVEPDGQRQQQQGHHAARDHGLEGGVGREADRPRDGDEGAADEGRHQGLDQGAAHGGLDLVEPEAQHRDQQAPEEGRDQDQSRGVRREQGPSGQVRGRSTSSSRAPTPPATTSRTRRRASRSSRAAACR